MGINFFIQKKLQVYNKKILTAKDKRMEITSETINCLKVLKLYGWDDKFLERVVESRNNEMDLMKKMLVLFTWNIFFLQCAPVLISIVSIGVYQFLVDTLDISNMLMALTIFNMLQEPIRTIPYSLNSFLEVFISLGRIEVRYSILLLILLTYIVILLLF